MTRNAKIHSANSKENLIRRWYGVAGNPWIITNPVLCNYRADSRWEVKVESDNFRLTAIGPAAPNVSNAYFVRESFLGISTAADLAEFCRTFGPPIGEDVLRFSLAQFLALQKRVATRRELDSAAFFQTRSGDSPEDRLLQEIELQEPVGKLVFGQVPYFEIDTDDVLMAVLYANYLDQMAGAKVQRCPECHRQFERPNQKRKDYCSTACQQKAGKKRYEDAHPELKKGTKNAKA